MTRGRSADDRPDLDGGVRRRPPVGAVRLAAGERPRALAPGGRRPGLLGDHPLRRHPHGQPPAEAVQLGRPRRDDGRVRRDEPGGPAPDDAVDGPARSTTASSCSSAAGSRRATPRRLRGRIEELAREIVDDVIERGECDLVHDVAGRLPSGLIAELMGIPRSRRRAALRADRDDAHHRRRRRPRPRSTRRRSTEMLGYAAEAAARKRAEPGDDIASTLVQAEVDGDRLTDGELQWFFLLLVNAGGDTTRNLLAAGIQLLFDHPDERARLQADLDGLLADGRRGDAALHVARRELPPHGDGGHRDRRPADRGRRQADGVLRLGEPRRGGVRRPRPLRRRPRPRTRTWRSAAAARTCASGCTSPASRSP